MINTVKLLFFLYKSKLNSKGKTPIYCRLTLANKRKQFSSGFYILPNDWDVENHRVKNSNPLAAQINRKLAFFEKRVLDITLSYEMKEEGYTLNDIWNEMVGRKTQPKGFIEVFEMYIKEVESLVGTSYSPATLQKFKGIIKQVKDFIKFKYNVEEIPLTNLKLKFLLDLEYYLLTQRKMKQVSINKTIQRIKKITRHAIAHEYLEKDPFLLHKAKTVNLEIIYLSPDELEILEKYEFESDRLTKVRDCFVFCCYTGLPYREMADLRERHITKGFDNKDWIKMKRQKTQKPLMIPILKQAADILDKYKSVDTGDALLPIISNQRFNSYLKEIAKEVGIKKKLSHHVARKTFASTVLLHNDVPMEVVSELLGHSDIKTTQKHYAKVTNKRVSSQMNKLSDKLDSQT